MGKIKIVTDKKHRFGKVIDISGEKILVDSTGNSEIEESKVTLALIAGFELVDKDQKFDSEEQMDAKTQIEQTLEDARKTAEAIIEDAKQKAKELLAEAQRQVEALLKNNQVDEKVQYRKNLEKLTVNELMENLSKANVPEESYKGKKKAELIELIFELAFSEK